MTSAGNIYDQLIGLPVSVQLNAPIAAHISQQEIVLDDDGETCGKATPAETLVDPSDPSKGSRPIALQILEGQFEDYDDFSICIGTMSVDGETPMRHMIPHRMVGCVFFAPKHVEKNPPRIIVPGVN